VGAADRSWGLQGRSATRNGETGIEVASGGKTSLFLLRVTIVFPVFYAENPRRTAFLVGPVDA
jgi:hypothetical protein